MSDAVTRLNAALSGRYRVERELGEGGMAMVYLADDLKHERKVALKVLKPELGAEVGGGANPQLVAHSSQLIWRVQRIRHIFADPGGRATFRSFIYTLS